LLVILNKKSGFWTTNNTDDQSHL